VPEWVAQRFCSASLFGNSVTCGTLSSAPLSKVTITDKKSLQTRLAILNNASTETGAMLRLLLAISTGGSYNFLTACVARRSLLIMWHLQCLETFASRNDGEHLSAVFLGSGRTPKDLRLPARASSHVLTNVGRLVFQR
jgi:hypothetical protein